jgi:hypothetical protein
VVYPEIYDNANFAPYHALATVGLRRLLGKSRSRVTYDPFSSSGQSISGLPLGAQAIGPFLEEFIPIRITQLAEQLLGGSKLPPALPVARQNRSPTQTPRAGHFPDYCSGEAPGVKTFLSAATRLHVLPIPRAAEIVTTGCESCCIARRSIRTAMRKMALRSHSKNLRLSVMCPRP